MGAAASLITTLLIPAIISLLLYLLLSYAIIPLWQRYRGRYSRYIPLDTIASSSRTVTQRFQDTLAAYILPSSWQSNLSSRRFDSDEHNGSENDGFDEDEGEELFEVDNNRREAISLDANRGHEEGGRLSRDLEEVFRDDSDDEEANASNTQVGRQSR